MHPFRSKSTIIAESKVPVKRKVCTWTHTHTGVGGGGHGAFLRREQRSEAWDWKVVGGGGWCVSGRVGIVSELQLMTLPPLHTGHASEHHQPASIAPTLSIGLHCGRGGSHGHTLVLDKRASIPLFIGTSNPDLRCTPTSATLFTFCGDCLRCMHRLDLIVSSSRRNSALSW
jgi:hypothetical protein